LPGVNASQLIDSVLAGCLAYAELARFGSAAAVAEALAAQDPDAPAGNRPTGPPPRADPGSLTAGRIAALTASGQADAQAGRTDEALAAYREALHLSEVSGAANHARSQFNALVDAIVLLYAKRGQGGLARLYTKKRR
jgi:tetratricopeptide (TPR) repeat protein